MNEGDFVTRESYGNDLVFRIERISGAIAVLRGIEYRLMADAPINDLNLVKHVESITPVTEALEKIDETKRMLEASRMKKTQHNVRHAQLKGIREDHSYFEVPGKVLHLDGDPNYLKKCMEWYGKLRVPAEGHYMLEELMPQALEHLLPKVKPDIVVITGHDGIYKHSQHDLYNLKSYKNSHHFMKAVQVSRQYERNRDALTIVAGACQSHFEALLQAGANFASSPGRVLIHALDPVQIAAKIAYTPIRDSVNMMDVIHHTVSGLKGLGGIETLGCYRIGLPNIQNYE